MCCLVGYTKEGDGQHLVNPFRWFGVTGFYNPLALAYMLIRVSLRFFFGGEIRNKILKATNLETLEEFLKRIHFPKHLTYTLLVKETEARIQRNIFRHEPQVSSFIINKKGSVFVDIGANVGYFSFLVYNNFETILAVEPHPDNVKIMNMIKTGNNYSKVKICPFAIGDRDADGVKLYLGSHCAGHSLLTYHSLPPYGNQGQPMKTKTVTLKTLLKNYEKIDLIKVDVEGAEWLVLEGAKGISNKIRSWIIELHDWNRREELEKWLSNRNYRYEWIDANHIYAERD
jgi:FkbM family methyltransferase